MKKLGFSVLAVFVVCTVLLISSGLVSALTSDQAVLRALLSNSQPQQGETITALIFFQNNSTDSVAITYVGLHFDWMPTDGFYGFNLSSAPVTVQAGGSYVFSSPITVTVPEDSTVGVHTYYLEIDGTQGASETTFSFDSDTVELLVDSNGQATPTPSSTNSGGQPADQNLLLYGAIGAAVIIVVLLVIVLVMRKNRTQPKPAANQGTNQPETPPPPPSPEKKPNPEQDFDI